VVLDVISAPSEYETVRQLLLRNQFATELTALGPETVVLAIGPAGAEAVEEQRQVLAAGFAGGHSAAQVCGALHARWTPGGDRAVRRVLPWLGTALFSCVPPDALLAPGRLRAGHGDPAP
jgi:hypothetical protein